MTDQTMNNLLDETLDDLADLPQSAPFPAGAHMAKMFIHRDEKKPAMYVVKFKHTGAGELSKPTDTMPKAGDESVVFLHTRKKDGTVNEIGQGQLKVLIAPIAERLGTKSVNECVLATKEGLDVGIVTYVRKQDGYPDSMGVNKLQLA